MGLAEIGIIILKRNEIQTRQQSVRHRLRRMNEHFKNKSLYLMNQKQTGDNILIKKYHKVKISDMRLTILKLECEMSNIVLELAEFTKETHSKLMQLLKTNNTTLYHNRDSNSVSGVWVHDHFIEIARIEKIVLNYHTENILLGGSYV